MEKPMTEDTRPVKNSTPGIPKTIHYVWLGKGEIPPRMQKCMESWHRVMPDYEIRLWDEESIKEFDCVFVQEAMAEKKWAFASDVIRLYALYTYGGIYLDTDVEVLKPFDDLLGNDAFIARETCMHIFWQSAVNHLTTCCMGCRPGNEYIGNCLRYYEGRHFVTSADRSLPSELRLDMRTNSDIMHQMALLRGYRPSILHNEVQTCDGTVTIYPSDYFEPHGVTPESYCIHLALGTWRDRYGEPGQQPAAAARRPCIADKLKGRFWLAIERLARRSNRLIIKIEDD